MINEYNTKRWERKMSFDYCKRMVAGMAAITSAYYNHERVINENSLRFSNKVNNRLKIIDKLTVRH